MDRTLGEESCFLPYFLGFLKGDNRAIFEGTTMCYCFVSEGIHHGFHVPASVDHQQLRNLKKITLMACRLPAWRKKSDGAQ